MPIALEGLLADRSRWRPTRCSIGKAMEVVGTRSAMLLVREAFYGTTRFDDFAHRVGITEAVAAARLKELVEIGIFDKRPYRDPGQRTRHEYVLTEMGRGLLPTVIALMQWGDTYLQDDGGPLEVVDRNGHRVWVQLRSEAGDEVDLEDLLIRSNSRRDPRHRHAGPA